MAGTPPFFDCLAIALAVAVKTCLS